jgi:hypothetical protein
LTATALISRAGRAIVRDGESYYLLTVDAPIPALVDATYWAHLRGLYPGCDLVAADAHPFPAVRTKLIEAWSEQLGLDLILSVLDRDHGEALRRETSDELERFFGRHPTLVQSLRALLLSVEAPPEADFAGGLSAANAAGAKQVHKILTELSQANATIAKVLSAWSDARAQLPLLAEQSSAIRVGARLRAVGRVVMCLQDSSPDAWPRLRTWFQGYFEPALAGAASDVPALIERWLAPLRGSQPVTPARVSVSSYRQTRAPAFIARRYEQTVAA